MVLIKKRLTGAWLSIMAGIYIFQTLRIKSRFLLNCCFLLLNRALDPLIFGDYPSEMRRYLGNQLPRFTSAETMFLKDSIDYIAVNHYTTSYAKDCIYSSCSLTANRAISGFVDGVAERDGVQIGEPVCTENPCYPHFSILFYFHLCDCVDRRELDRFQQFQEASEK